MSSRHGTPFVFLDKDGTLLSDVPFDVDPSRLTLTRGAGIALRTLCDAGYRIAVVTHQPGVGLGFVPLEVMESVERRLRELLAAYGVSVTGFAFCPHAPPESITYGQCCGCRKPQPGLLLALAAQRGADLARSWMIGDSLDDVEAGWRAGCRTVLLVNGAETEWQLSPERMPYHVARDLADAAGRIIVGDRAARAARRTVDDATDQEHREGAA